VEEEMRRNLADVRRREERKRKRKRKG